MGRDDLIKRKNDLVRLCGNHTYQPIIKNTREFLEQKHGRVYPGEKSPCCLLGRALSRNGYRKWSTSHAMYGLYRSIFQKKAKQGIATPKREMALIRNRLHPKFPGTSHPQ